MSKRKAICGARTRRGSPCPHPPGWGTDHVGTGRCKLHGGSTPNHRKRAAKDQAAAFTRGMLGAAIEIEGADALALSVHLSHGMVEYYRAQINAAKSTEAVVYIDGYNRALADFNRFAKNAVDANISERLANVAERAGEQIVLICEAGLKALSEAGVKMSNEQRRLYAEAVGKEIEAHEETATTPLALPAPR